jgi:hypothetical protein
MGTASRLRHLQSRRNILGASSFQIGECVEHRGILVEVRRHPPARVIVTERIQPDMLVAAQVLSDHVMSDVGSHARLPLLPL